jgi:hypothetical protein
MGLDMYAFAVSKEKSIDQFTIAPDAGKPEELQYWRKHHDLHGWMEQLYRAKGGTKESFNCVPVQLTVEDLDQLQSDLLGERLPQTQGFFFGINPPDLESLKEDLMFIQKCRIALEEGKTVYYDSWW